MKMRFRLFCLFLTVLFLNFSAFARQPGPVTGIICPLSEELTPLEKNLKNKQITKSLGFSFLSGTISGRRVVLVCSGMGKVNSSVAAALLIDNYNPSEIIMCGIAGGLNPELRPGDIVIGRQTVQHDYGIFLPEGMKTQGTVHPLTGETNPLFYPPDKTLYDLALAIKNTISLPPLKSHDKTWSPSITAGVIVSGDVFVASSAKVSDLRIRLNAEAVEMEGAAIAQICHQVNLPFIDIRSISDMADEKAVETQESFMNQAAENAAQFTIRMLKELHLAENEDKNAPATVSLQNDYNGLRIKCLK